jgi:hypothetical protein
LANQTVLILLTLLLVSVFLRRNVPAYLASLFFLGLCLNGIRFFSQPSAFMRWNGVALLLLAGFVLYKLGTEAIRRRPVLAGRSIG